VELQRTQDAPMPPCEPPPFREVFDQGFAYVFASLRRLGVREADLEDVTHEVFMVAHKKLAEFDPTRSLLAWLFGFAYRLASDYRKRAHHRREVPDGAAAERIDPAPLPEGQVADEQRRRVVLTALEDLDVDKRAVLVMHDIDGHAMPLVASTLGIPLNTAYSRLRLARAELRDAVQRIFSDAEQGPTRRRAGPRPKPQRGAP
jgi:RNA polymerase sigma-70 factor (ECF subfamily)